MPGHQAQVPRQSALLQLYVAEVASQQGQSGWDACGVTGVSPVMEQKFPSRSPSVVCYVWLGRSYQLRHRWQAFGSSSTADEDHQSGEGRGPGRHRGAELERKKPRRVVGRALWLQGGPSLPRRLSREPRQTAGHLGIRRNA